MELERNNRRSVRALVAVLFAILMLAFAPVFVTPAYARSYEITSVNIDATVGSDGSLTVVETRTFDFDGSFNGVYWFIPMGYNENNGNYVEVEVLSAGIVEDGTLRAYTQSKTGANETYSVSESGSNELVKIYSSQDNESVSFQITYRSDGIVTRWSDTGELYWKFVSDGWEVESQNVTCTVHLPVPTGESVVGGDNVRAWGHGPLDATVAFSGNDIVYTVPGVGSDEYAEARIVFPAEWLSGCSVTEQDKLDSILSEEETYANEANGQRILAGIAAYGSTLLTFGVDVAVLISLYLAWKAYKETHVPRFSGTYFRDVPTSDHPVVLASLLTNGHAPSTQALTASLMHLTSLGIARLEKVEDATSKRHRDDYKLTLEKELPPLSPDADAATASAWKVDNATINFAFNKLGDTDQSQGARPEVYFSGIQDRAEAAPDYYYDIFKDWEFTVEGESTQRFTNKYVVGKSSLPKKQRRRTLKLLILSVVVTALYFFIGVFLSGLPFWIWIVAVLACGALIPFVTISLKRMQDLTQEGVDVKAEVAALKRWLCDFTRLDEAVPTDVVLWNRLLVMAVALGVADKVIEQLKIAVPTVIDDPNFMPVYGWYAYGVGGVPPIATFAGVADRAHKVSLSSDAASTFSSASGGGGGFSGGGGGGFGGGGGGGAF